MYIKIFLYNILILFYLFCLNPLDASLVGETVTIKGKICTINAANDLVRPDSTNVKGRPITFRTAYTFFDIPENINIVEATYYTAAARASYTPKSLPLPTADGTFASFNLDRENNLALVFTNGYRVALYKIVD